MKLSVETDETPADAHSSDKARRTLLSNVEAFGAIGIVVATTEELAEDGVVSIVSVSEPVSPDAHGN